MNSCMRLSMRRKVDLPQPDGPMRPVTVFSGKWSVTSASAWCLSNHAWRPRASSPPPPLTSRFSALRRVRSSMTVVSVGTEVLMTSVDSVSGVSMSGLTFWRVVC